MQTGHKEKEILAFGDFPFPIWIQNQDTLISYQFNILAHALFPLPDIKVDELTVKFQSSTFFISHIRNWLPDSQVLSIIHMQENGLQGWAVQTFNNPHDEENLTVWSLIDLPHTKEFLESDKWLEGLTWEEYYSNLLFFIPEMY